MHYPPVSVRRASAAQFENIMHTFLSLTILLPIMVGAVCMGVFLLRAVLYIFVLCRDEDARELRRTGPLSHPDSIRCIQGLQSGWGRIENVRQRPSAGVPGGPAVYVADLDCDSLEIGGLVRYDVVKDAVWPLDGCPESASVESVIATQLKIDRLCGGCDYDARLAAMDLVKLPSGAALVVRGQDILRSVEVAAHGTTLVVSTRHAVTRHTGQVFGKEAGVPLMGDFLVAWTERGPGGTILFSSVRYALRHNRAPRQGRWTSTVPHGDTRQIRGMVDARLEFRAFPHWFWNLNQFGPWEVALVKGPFPGTYEAVFGSEIAMVTHQPPTPIVAATNSTDDDPSCMICFGKFVVGDPVARLRGCGHTLHGPCLRTWLTQPGMRRMCPMCQRDLPTAGPTPAPRPFPWWGRN